MWWFRPSLLPDSAPLNSSGVLTHKNARRLHLTCLMFNTYWWKTGNQESNPCQSERRETGRSERKRDGQEERGKLSFCCLDFQWTCQLPLPLFPLLPLPVVERWAAFSPFSPRLPSDPDSDIKTCQDVTTPTIFFFQISFGNFLLTASEFSHSLHCVDSSVKPSTFPSVFLDSF